MNSRQEGAEEEAKRLSTFLELRYMRNSTYQERANGSTAKAFGLGRRGSKSIVSSYKSELYDPKIVRFVKNGDRFFEAIKVNVSQKNFRTWDVLLSELSRVLGLPSGVRNIYTPDGGHRVTNLSQFEHQRTYVCASTETFRKMDYKQVKSPSWQTTSKVTQQPLPFDSLVKVFGARSVAGPKYPKRMKPIQTSKGQHEENTHNSVSNPFVGRGELNMRQHRHRALRPSLPVKPTLLTVIRNGPPPRKCVSVLLNKTSVESWEQARGLIGENLLANGLRDCLKLFQLDGEEVQSLSQLWKAGNMLIAVGMEDFDINTFMTGAGDKQTRPAEPQTWNRESFQGRAFPKGIQRSGASPTSNPSPSQSPEPHPSPTPSSSPSRSPRLTSPGLCVQNAGQETKQSSCFASSSSSSPDREEERERYVVLMATHEEGKGDQQERHQEETLLPALLSMTATAAIGSRWKHKLGIANGLLFGSERVMTTSSESCSELAGSPTDSTTTTYPVPCVSTPQGMLPTHLQAQSPQSDISLQWEESLVDMILPHRQIVQTGSCTELSSNSSNIVLRTVGIQTNSSDDQELVRVQGSSTQPSPASTNNNSRENHQRSEGTATCQTEVHLESSSNADTVHYQSKHQAKYQIGNIVGEGRYALIKGCTEKKTGRKFLARVINKAKVFGHDDLIYSELRILKMLNHDNIMKVEDEWETSDEICLLMEQIEGADLFDAILHCHRFSEESTAKVMHQLGVALVYLHAHQIVHRDIIPENIFLFVTGDGTWNLKLGGFGLAKTVTEPLALVCGNPYYMAPEMMLETGYGTKVDVWSSGVISYLLLSGTMPFGRRNKVEFLTSVKSGSYSFPSPFWNTISAKAKDFISHLMVVSPQHRYSSSMMLQHSWIMDSSWDHQPKELVEFLNAKASGRNANIGVLTVTALDKRRISEFSQKSKQKFAL